MNIRWIGPGPVFGYEWTTSTRRWQSYGSRSLFVSALWVEAPNRRQGIGRRLITDAEQKALECGCRFSFLDTFSFQAPGFYLLSGYETLGVVECGLGLQRLYLRKNLCRDTRKNPTERAD